MRFFSIQWLFELFQFILLSIHFYLSFFACHLFLAPIQFRNLSSILCNSRHYFVAGKEFWQKTSKRSKESRVAIIDAEAKETQEFFCFLNDLGNVVTKTRQADERNVRKEVVNGCDMNDIEVCILYGICAICAMYSFKVGHLQASVFHFPPTLK